MHSVVPVRGKTVLRNPNLNPNLESQETSPPPQYDAKHRVNHARSEDVAYLLKHASKQGVQYM
jgi:hypothetical protein